MPTYTHDFSGSRLISAQNRRMLSNSILKQDHIDAVMKLVVRSEEKLTAFFELERVTRESLQMPSNYN